MKQPQAYDDRQQQPPLDTAALSAINSGPTVDHGKRMASEIIANHNGAQRARGARQGGSTDRAEKAAPAAAQLTAGAHMRNAKRWLLWREQRDSKGKIRKVPYYVDGSKRQGELDTPTDQAKLATYEQALDRTSDYSGLGFALGPDGNGGQWQGIDLDDVPQNQLTDLADNLPGYVEMSPSGKGCHAIGYGADFQTLGPNDTGVEAYAKGRFFTVTSNEIRDGALEDLAPWVSQHLVPRHGVTRTKEAASSLVHVEDRTATELRSALNAIPPDDYHVWISMGHALSELEIGEELWKSWSQQSPKWKPEDARKWRTFRADRTGYQAVFAEAQRYGWVNPGRNAAQIEMPTEGGFQFGFAHHGEKIVEIDYIIDPWVPRAAVIGCYGRGEAGKSSFVAQMCARASSQVSTLWITSEESPNHVRQRHLACNGEAGALSVLEGLPTKIDPVTKKAVATSFNVFEHMEPALLDFRRLPEARKDRPLGIVVLDAVVALVTWEKGRSANDDEAVKKLIAHLFILSGKYGVTFMLLGHLNKSTTREHIADAVTGSAAWTNSVRLAYMFVKDIESDNYEGFVRTVKSNTGTPFGATYRTVPCYILRRRPDVSGQRTHLVSSRSDKEHDVHQE